MTRSKGRKPRVMVNTCFGKIVSKLLKKFNISPQDIRDAIDLAPSTLNDWINGNVPANPDDVWDLLKYLRQYEPELTLEYLYHGEDADRKALVEKLKAAEAEKQRLEFENSKQLTFVSFLEEELQKSKKEKATNRNAVTDASP